MKLRGGTIGASPEAAPDAKAVREARVTAARRAGWEEVPAERLIPRGRGLLVDAETDACYRRYAGLTFERGSGRLLADRQTLSFYVDDAGAPVVLEKERQSWTELYARRVRQEQRRT